MAGAELLLRLAFTPLELSVIIPIYNEESTLGELYPRVRNVLEGMALAGGY